MRKRVWEQVQWGLLSLRYQNMAGTGAEGGGVGSLCTCTPCPGSDPDTEHPTFPELVVGGDRHSPGHIADCHLNPRAVPEIHRQTQSCLGSHLDPEPQTRRRLSVGAWEVTDGGIHRVSRNLHGDGSRAILSEGTELLGTRPGR